MSVCLRYLEKNRPARVVRVTATGPLAARIRDMGLISGAELTVIGQAPLKDPVALRMKNYTLTLRNNEADQIEVEPMEAASCRA